MSFNKEEHLTGLWKGFWEPHDKAFKLNGIFNSRLVILTRAQKGFCFNSYFSHDDDVERSCTESLSNTYSNVYRFCFSSANLTPHSKFKTLKDIVLHLIKLFCQHSDKKVYILEIKQFVYMLIVLQDHQDLPEINKIITPDMFNSWNVDSLISSQLLISMLEIRDNYPGFAGSCPQSLLGSLTEKELLRRAASFFLDKKIRLVTELRGKDLLKINCFYVNIDEICLMGYEKRSTKGFILVGKIEVYKSSLIVRFTRAIPLGSHKAARKAIEMTGGSRFLLSDGINLYGIGIEDTVNFTDKVLKIKFQNYNEWAVTCDNENKPIISIKNGTPVLPKFFLTEESFTDKIKPTFKNCEINYNRIYKIAKAAMNGSHGALIVVSNEAESEALRLGNQATLIEPTILEEEILEGIFSIDGAVMLDLQGTCYALGVILDGIADTNGDPARGSRYNSSVRYISSRLNQRLGIIQVIAIVVSEDGQFDIIS